MKKKTSINGKPLGSFSITIKDWQKLHPFKGKVYSSDAYYVKIANKVARIYREILNGSSSDEDMRDISLDITAYFEDVVSQLCIFSTFVKLYRSIYDKEFPWYKIDEEYIQDEVNLVDIEFVLWNSCTNSRKRESSIC